jgi:hypothetical protein
VRKQRTHVDEVELLIEFEVFRDCRRLNSVDADVFALKSDGIREDLGRPDLLFRIRSCQEARKAAMSGGEVEE